MDVSFDNGKMIVKHPSGYINTYTPDDLQLWLEEAKSVKTEMDVFIEGMESDIELLKASIPTTN